MTGEEKKVKALELALMYTGSLYLDIQEAREAGRKGLSHQGTIEGEVVPVAKIFMKILDSPFS